MSLFLFPFGIQLLLPTALIMNLPHSTPLIIFIIKVYQICSKRDNFIIRKHDIVPLISQERERELLLSLY